MPGTVSSHFQLHKFCLALFASCFLLSASGCSKWGGGKQAEEEGTAAPANLETRLEAFEENLKSIQETVEKQGDLLESLEKKISESKGDAEKSGDKGIDSEDLAKFKDALLDMDEELKQLQDEVNELKESKGNAGEIQQDLDY